MPTFWGSAIRGGLGKWLRKTSCVLRSRKCDGCSIRSACAYGFIFETEKTKGKNVNSRPHPIVLEPPVPAPESTRRGDIFYFNVILLDAANDFLPHMIYSLIKLGQEDGIGARTRHGYGRFVIESITCDGQTIFSHEAQELKRPAQKRILELSTNTKEQCNRLEVRFETPFRVKYKGKFSKEIPFHLLVRTALRRISSLESAYAGSEPPVDYKGLIADAKNVNTVSQGLCWQDVPRYSSRQKSKMMIGGPVGRVTYQGNLSRFLPYLRYCEKVHLGKQTFFGLGKISIHASETA